MTRNYFSASSQLEFKYFPYLVIFTLTLYACTWILFFVYWKILIKHEEKRRLQGQGFQCAQNWQMSKELTNHFLSRKFPPQLCQILTILLVVVLVSVKANLVIFISKFLILLLTNLDSRVSCFCGHIFLTFGYLDVYELGDSVHVWSRFGSWVGLLVILYFLLAMYMSTLGLIVLTTTPDVQWSKRVLVLARVLDYLMEVATSNALFVTLVQFIYFSPNTSQRNIAQHLLPSVFILFDFFQHKTIFRLRHYPVCLSLPLAYLRFQWITVYMGAIDWQYAFLYTDSRSYFAAYIGLFCNTCDNIWSDCRVKLRKENILSLSP